MFPFWSNPCYSAEPVSYKTRQERKLQFLKSVRDSLEARLAAVNAAVATIERQMEQQDAA